MSRKIYIIDDLVKENEMDKWVYIGPAGGTFRGMPKVVDSKVAVKMLEVYDKVQLFESIKIDNETFISVESADCNLPVCINIENRLRRYSLIESKQLCAALEAAVKYVESHRN